MKNLSHVTASAVIPDQLIPYVQAVSGLESEMAGKCVYHHSAGHVVLAGYPLNNPHDMDLVNESVQLLLQTPGVKRISVLSAAPLTCAPANATTTEDYYWKLDLPVAKPKGKLASLLRRASREVEILQTDWTEGHKALANQFCQSRNLDEGTEYLFQKLADYLAAVKSAELYSALDSAGNLKAFAIGDYSALGCAFYMFACRSPQAPPGASDLLLARLIGRASELGHSTLNLGLGINRGVEFFKQKWGAVKFLPYIETSWEVRAEKRKGWWNRVFGRWQHNMDRT